MKLPIVFLFLASTVFAEMNLYKNEEPQISVKNMILAKVNNNTISVIDVMKKMDMLMHQHYAQMADSPQARMQFYSGSWRPIFMEMIDTELILSDAAEKEIKLSDGEIHEEVENRFGPNVLLTLDKIGLTYEDAWKMVKNELIVHRMMWYFVHSKAMQLVTPQAIRDAYKQYLDKNPAFCEWVYRVVTIRSDVDGSALADDVHRILSEEMKSPELAVNLNAWEQSHPDCKVQISNDYTVKGQELSESHRAALSALAAGQYSQPIQQISRVDNKAVYRIFFLKEKTDHPAPAFEGMTNQLKNELLQKAVAKESDGYLQKLRKRYGFDPARIKETVPDNLQPFHLE